MRSMQSKDLLSSGDADHNNGLVRMRHAQRSDFTSIVASRSRTLYVGMTGDLEKRVFEHKWKEHDGFTADYNCDRLVWFESHQDVAKTIAREQQLKGWRREKKTTLHQQIESAWVDLSKDWYDVEPADLKRAADQMLT